MHDTDEHYTQKHLENTTKEDVDAVGLAILLPDYRA